jgi:hypothetical protein
MIQPPSHQDTKKSERQQAIGKSEEEEADRVMGLFFLLPAFALCLLIFIFVCGRMGLRWLKEDTTTERRGEHSGDS